MFAEFTTGVKQTRLARLYSAMFLMHRVLLVTVMMADFNMKVQTKLIV